MSSDYLQHYGVLGMHWGIRKDRSSSGVKKTKTQRKVDEIVGDKTKTRARKVAEVENVYRKAKRDMSRKGTAALMVTFGATMAGMFLAPTFPLSMAVVGSSGVGMLALDGATRVKADKLLDELNVNMADLTGEVQKYNKLV
jgi:hypothetical protein